MLFLHSRRHRYGAIRPSPARPDRGRLPPPPSQSALTDGAYRFWISKFVCFHDKRYPKDTGGAQAVRSLSHLAVQRKAAAAIQTQAPSDNTLVMCRRCRGNRRSARGSSTLSRCSVGGRLPPAACGREAACPGEYRLQDRRQETRGQLRDDDDHVQQVFQATASQTVESTGSAHWRRPCVTFLSTGRSQCQAR